MRVIPAILAKDKHEYIEKLRIVEKFSDHVQIDIMDGIFVPNETVSIRQLQDIKTPLKLIIHSMVSHPLSDLSYYLNLKPQTIIYHIESEDDIQTLIKNTSAYGVSVGLAVNPDTEIKKIRRFLQSIQEILIMTVYPGFSGQVFIADQLRKVPDLRTYKNDILVSVDGGVTLHNIKISKLMGVDIVYSASNIFSHPKPQEAYNGLVRAAS